MSKIKVSIIIPIYNAENYLKQCLDSIIDQTLEEIEIICVNDGSTDHSSQILEEYSQKDQRIKIINNENNGPGASRKIGLNYATGDFITFVDCDDWVKLDTYEKLYKNGVSNKSDIVILNPTRYDESNDEFIYMEGFDIAKYLDDNNIDFNNFVFNYKDIKPFVLNRSFSAWSKLYKAEFLNGYDDFYFPKNIFYEDVPFHVQVLLRAKRISFCKEELYCYRISRFNSMLDISLRSKNVFDIFIIVDKVKEILIENNKLRELELEFNLFVIRQLSQWLEKCHNNYKQEFFEKTKNHFESINLKNDFDNKLSIKYENIINSDTYKEFALTEEIQLLSSDYTKMKIENEKNLNIQKRDYEQKLNIQKTNYEEKLITQKTSYEEKFHNQKTNYEEKLNKQKQKYDEEIGLQKYLIDEMISSNSWKLTVPLRKFGTLVKK